MIDNRDDAGQPIYVGRGKPTGRGEEDERDRRRTCAGGASMEFLFGPGSCPEQEVIEATWRKTVSSISLSPGLYGSGRTFQYSDL